MIVRDVAMVMWVVAKDVATLLWVVAKVLLDNY